MKLKNFLQLGLYPLLGVLTACSDNLPLNEVPPTQSEGAIVSAPKISLSEAEDSPMMSTRATYFDGHEGKVFFTWEVYDEETKKGDKVGIIPVSDEATQQMEYKCRSVSVTAEDAKDGISHALFKQEDATFAWEGGQTYRAYYPFYSGGIDVTAVPLDYTGQTQTGKPDMENYFEGNKENYYKTEKNSSAHLTAKSFMISNVATAEAQKSLPFKMSYLCGIVRFYLSLPTTLKDGSTISEIRLVTSKPVFHEHATLNVKNGVTTASGEATNNLLLQLNDVTLSGTTYGNYLVAYMMAHPIALTDAAFNDTNLYIYVRGKDSGGNDVFFRNNNPLKHQDITAGKITRFTVKPLAQDDPIDVQPITVQEWQEGLTLDNEGKGTGNW